jgi:hypothetical protein
MFLRVTMNNALTLEEIVKSSLTHFLKMCRTWQTPFFQILKSRVDASPPNPLQAVKSPVPIAQPPNTVETTA